MSGQFITIEGIEGVGKSTSILYLQRYLVEKGVNPIITREPGGTPIGEDIRGVFLKHHEDKMVADTEVLLIFANRAQHFAQKIAPALEENRWVICDRFTDATYAYQSGGRGLASERIRALEDWLSLYREPDLTILLIAPVKIALMRTKHRGALDRIESEELSFFSRVQVTYLQRAQQYPKRIHLVDAQASIAEVQAQLRKIVDDFLATLSTQSI